MAGTPDGLCVGHVSLEFSALALNAARGGAIADDDFAFSSLESTAAQKQA